jgi:hypothetical protein
MWAFIDEYGNANLDTEKKDVSHFFIVAAVLAPEEDLRDLREGVEAVRKRFFQTGEMKSKSLGSNRQRWVTLLEELSELPFRFYGLAVDKNRLDPSSGYQWKGSFYKNLCGHAYGKLLRAHRELQVRADEYGRSEFMRSFAAYITREHQQSLFQKDYFAFVNGADEVLVQLADIIAGLLARVYDPSKRLPRAEELLGVLHKKCLLLDEWPPRYRMVAGAAEPASASAPDDRIAVHSMEKAEQYVVEHGESSDEEQRARVAVLERLLFERRFGDGSKAVATGALLDNLRARGIAEKGETWLRRAVIAPLRDREVLITSSALGYKLPMSKADMVAFVRHAESVCVPMLNRVRTACGIVKLATNGDVDVLAEPGVRAVGVLTEALDKDAHAVDPEEP